MRISNQNVFRRATTWTLLYNFNIMRRTSHWIYEEVGDILCGWGPSILGLNKVHEDINAKIEILLWSLWSISHVV